MKALLAFLAILWLSGGTHFAQRSGALQAEGNLLIPQPRAGAPEWLDIKLTSPGTAPRIGVLEIAAVVDGRVGYIHRTQEIAVTGTQQFRFLLPPRPGHLNAFSAELRLSFLAGPERTPLTVIHLPNPQSAARRLVLAVVREPGSGRISELWRAFRAEAFFGASSFKEGEMMTTLAAFDEADLPVDPVGYCAFDAVLLEGSSLGSLREKSRTALRQWVHAGGKLAVIAPSGLTAADLRFLNEIGAPDPRWTPLQDDHAPSSGRPASLLQARANFGGLLVGPRPPENPADDPAWRQGMAFFWKARVQSPKPEEQSPQTPPQMFNLDAAAMAETERNRQSALLEPLHTLLLPTTLRPISPAIFWALLGLFVFCVGPLDWWVLGRLRRRRLTWLLFPAVATGITAAIMNSAASSLQGLPHRKTVVVTDVGNDGRIVRESRLDIAFPPTGGWLVSEAEDALAVPVRRPQSINSNPGAAQPPEYAGAFPQRYRCRYMGFQWTPTLLRQTRLRTAEDSSGVDWASLDPRRQPSAPRLTFTSQDEPHPDHHQVTSGLVETMSTLGPRGLSRQIVSLSPNGADNLEDLACLDPKAEDQSLVVVTTPIDNGVRIWRRLYLH